MEQMKNASTVFVGEVENIRSLRIASVDLMRALKY
jgi:hypothetical protein